MANVERTIISLLYLSFPEGQLLFNVAFMTTRIQYFQQEQLTSNLLHVIFAFIITVVLNLLALKYQGHPITPFDTHPVTMRFGIACSLAYCLAYGFQLKCHVSPQRPSTHAPTLGRGMVVFGSLSLISFVSILFSSSVQPILFGLYALLLTGFLLHAQLTKLFGARERRVRQTSHRAHWPVAATTLRNQGNILPL